jgi:NTE family protein
MTERALVLGAGGITGIAWEWGILAGLAEAGVDLAGAGLVIGTSAGSVVGARWPPGWSPGNGTEPNSNRRTAMSPRRSGWDR